MRFVNDYPRWLRTKLLFSEQDKASSLFGLVRRCEIQCSPWKALWTESRGGAGARYASWHWRLLECMKPIAIVGNLLLQSGEPANHPAQQTEWSESASANSFCQGALRRRQSIVMDLVKIRVPVQNEAGSACMVGSMFLSLLLL